MSSIPVIARLVRAIHFSPTQENWIARMKRAMTIFGNHKLLIAVLLSVAVGVSACGVKNDLVMPDGKPTPKGQKDPSKPPTTQQQGL